MNYKAHHNIIQLCTPSNEPTKETVERHTSISLNCPINSQRKKFIFSNYFTQDSVL